MLKPRFTPEIQLGHLIQAAVIGLSSMGAIFGAYMGLRSSIDSTNFIFDKRMALIESIQQMQAKDDTNWRAESRAAAQTLNSAISQLTREIADLRVGIANKADRK